MKKLIAILFENDFEFKEYSNSVCEKFANLPPVKEFCGIWGEILFNHSEVLSAICTTINHFVDNTDRTEIIFGCCKKDYDSIISKTHAENCVIEVIPCKNV